MKIAVPVLEGQIAPHFGKCESFVLFTLKKKRVIKETVFSSPQHEPGGFPDFLAGLGVNLLIADGLGIKAIEQFKQKNIQVLTGIHHGDPKKHIQDFIEGKLEEGMNLCDH